MNIQAIIFDLFGVIRPDRILLAYRHFGGDPDRDAEFIANTIESVNRGREASSRAVFARHFGVTPDEWMAVIKGGRANDQKLLNYCKELRKDYKVGLLSNVGADVLPLLFAAGELEHYFDAAIASGMIGHAKPEPEAYLTIAEKLGVVPDHCIMVDDQPAYCDGARAVGMQAIHYRNFTQMQCELAPLLTRSV